MRDALWTIYAKERASALSFPVETANSRSVDGPFCCCVRICSARQFHEKYCHQPLYRSLCNRYSSSPSADSILSEATSLSQCCSPHLYGISTMRNQLVSPAFTPKDAHRPLPVWIPCPAYITKSGQTARRWQGSSAMKKAWT